MLLHDAGVVGGIVDVEFVVQMFQLKYGRAQPRLRTKNTWEALDALRDAGVLRLDGRLSRIKPLPGMSWQLGKGVYVYFPEANDAALYASVSRGRSRRHRC